MAALATRTPTPDGLTAPGSASARPGFPPVGAVIAAQHGIFATRSPRGSTPADVTSESRPTPEAHAETGVKSRRLTVEFFALDISGQPICFAR
jgi:hypothetical protein